MKMQCWAIVLAALVLAGCGVETATTAATAAQLKAQEAEQAKRQMEAAKKEIEAAQQAMRQQIENADHSVSEPAAAPATATP